MLAISLLLPTLLFIGLCEDPGLEDIVQAVPGYGDGAPRVFSNYLTTKTNLSLHYVLVESKAGPDNNDPLTLWLGGGPGCSSKIGFLFEIGPFYLPAETPYDSKPLIPNPYSWHTLSNILFIDSPPGVGYSLASEGYIYNDQNTA